MDKTQIIVPLAGFSCDNTPIIIKQDQYTLILERLEEFEQELLRESCYIENYHVDASSYKLVIYDNDKKDEEVTSKIFEELFLYIIKFIIALKLIHKGNFSAPYTFLVKNEKRYEFIGTELYVDDWYYDNDLNYGSHQYHNYSEWDGDYHISNSDIEELKHLYNILVNPTYSKHIKNIFFGLRRFNQSYTQIAIEDRIITLTIALESVLLYKLDDELSYRFSNRGSYILRKVRDPTYTYDLLKAIYATRSKIVHEGLTIDEISEKYYKKGRIGKILLDEIFEKAEDITRDVLKEYLIQYVEKKDGKSLDEFNIDIDTSIISQMIK